MNVDILEMYIQQEWAPDFRYARHDDTPWAPFRKAAHAAGIALVTSGGVHLKQDPPFAGIDDPSYREIPCSASASDLMVSHPFFESQELEQDIDALFPLTRLRELASMGIIGRAAPRHFSFMGMVPHWDTYESHAKEVGDKLRNDGVDAVILTPGSPICNHSLAIIQRLLEASGLATISLTLEPELTRMVKVPRAMIVDFPPGCPVGEPGDRDKQLKVVKEALEYLTTIQQPGTVWKSPFKWTRSCSTPMCKL